MSDDTEYRNAGGTEHCGDVEDRDTDTAETHSGLSISSCTQHGCSISDGCSISESSSPQASQEPSVLDFVKAQFAALAQAMILNISAKQSTGYSTSALSTEERVVPELPDAPDTLHPPDALCPPHPEQVVETNLPAETEERIDRTVQSAGRSLSAPWRAGLAIGLALLAQTLLEPRNPRPWLPGAILYALAAAALVWSVWRGEWKVDRTPESSYVEDPLSIRRTALLISLPAILIAFFALGGNQFTRFNLFLWVLTAGALIYAFWLGAPPWSQWSNQIRTFIIKPTLRINLNQDLLVALAAIALVLFFRLYDLQSLPNEMTSDHAEKLLDVWDVLNGQTHIFFSRNTGREAMQFYLTAAIAKYLGTGVSFISLKIGTALMGLMTLVFIYKLGKEIGSREIGLLAVVFTGIGYWPNVITRIALRFTFYPAFVAPTLFYLLRGLRTSRRNDFILAGLMLGLGLHTYIPIRALPIAVVVAVGLYLLHHRSKDMRTQTLLHLAVLVLVAFVLFLPLLRVAQQYPEIFNYRTLTRMSDLERPLPGPAWLIFLQNLWNASTMYFWKDGEIWTVGITGRPALDIVSAGLYFLGSVYLLVRYIRQRSWLDLFLLLSVPILMLPSILALAFPSENPALNRASGAIVPVFIIVAIGLQGLLNAIRSQLNPASGRAAAWLTCLLLLVFSISQNYSLIFKDYREIYKQSSWNTSEMGWVIRNFADTIGSADTAWVIPYPHWVDTRLVGMNASNPMRDYALTSDRIETTLQETRAKLFLVKVDDVNTLERLRQLYPQGWEQLYQSNVPTKEFWVYIVPPSLYPAQPSQSPAAPDELKSIPYPLPDMPGLDQISSDALYPPDAPYPNPAP